jgi:hypothetical protein
VDVPPKKVPYFKPGKELKELINLEAPGAAAALAPSVTPAAAVAPAIAPVTDPDVLGV